MISSLIRCIPTIIYNKKLIVVRFSNFQVKLQAWKLWSQGKGMELIDPLLIQLFVGKDEVVRCIHIGLLCVQEDPADRPSMSTVIVMLGSQTIILPLPAQPAFSVGRVVDYSVNEVTISNLLPR